MKTRRQARETLREPENTPARILKIVRDRRAAGRETVVLLHATKGWRIQDADR